MKDILINHYIDYLNNYLSVEKFAEDNGLSCYDALTIIQLGKKYNEEPKAEISKPVTCDLFETIANVVRP